MIRYMHLFFSVSELAAFRQRVIKQPCAIRWKQFVRNANACLRKPAFGLRDVRNALGVCGLTGFAYAILQDRRYGMRAIKEAQTLLAAPRWHAGYEWNRAADLPTSEAAMACAFVYDWCRDLFTTEEAAEFRRRLLCLSTRVYLDSIDVYKDWWIDNPVSNWCGVCHGGNGLAALAMYHEEPLARRAVHAAWKAVPRFLRHLNLVDGGGHEGVMYKVYGESFGHIFFAAAARLFGTDGGLYADVNRKRSGYWLIYMKGPDERYPNFNNMNEETCSGSSISDDERGPSSTLCALFESKVPGGDALLRWGADNGGASFYYYGTDPLWFVFRSTRPIVKDAAEARRRGALSRRRAGCHPIEETLAGVQWGLDQQQFAQQQRFGNVRADLERHATDPRSRLRFHVDGRALHARGRQTRPSVGNGGKIPAVRFRPRISLFSQTIFRQ